MAATGYPPTSGPMAADYTSSKFHRLFGDVNGNRTVNNMDFAVFRNSYLKSDGDPEFRSILDFDGNGAVNNLDFGQFRGRFQKFFDYEP